MNNKTWSDICKIQQRIKENRMDITEIKQILESAERSKINPKNVVIKHDGLRKEFYTLPDETHSLSDLKQILALHERVEGLERKVNSLQYELSHSL